MIKNILSPLDKLRQEMGPEYARSYFDNLHGYDRMAALNLLNHENLNFGTLYIIQDRIDISQIFRALNARSSMAVKLTREILTQEKIPVDIRLIAPDYIELTRSALEWMIVTGAADDGMSADYDKVMDISSSLIINVFNDKTLLPVMSDMIFRRHQRGLFIHDLIWTFFQCRDPYSLILVANRLKSGNPADFKLAQKLLNFIPDINNSDMRDSEQQYILSIDWLRENSPFMSYSGENFQHTGDPRPYKIIPEGKYLCSPVSPLTGRILRKLSERESSLLSEFKSLDYNTRTILADYSFKLCHSSREQWEIWISLPLRLQLEQVNSGGMS